MRRMYSENQLIALIQQYGGDIEKIKEELIGSYVRIMDAPSSTTLTDEQIAQIQEGVFIKGTFLGQKNPILFPTVAVSDAQLTGVILSGYSNQNFLFSAYNINLSTKVISLDSSVGFQLQTIYKQLNLKGLTSINNKSFPTYPSNTGTFILKCVDGVLTWVADAE